MARQVDAMAHVEIHRLGQDRLALRPLAQDHQMPFLGQGMKRADQARQVFHRAQPARVPTHFSPAA
jgi:hypothetical protein